MLQLGPRAMLAGGPLPAPWGSAVAEDRARAVLDTGLEALLVQLCPGCSRDAVYNPCQKPPKALCLPTGESL